MQKSFGKCSAAFMTDAAPGAPFGYCQVRAMLRLSVLLSSSTYIAYAESLVSV